MMGKLKVMDERSNSVKLYGLLSETTYDDLCTILHSSIGCGRSLLRPLFTRSLCFTQLNVVNLLQLPQLIFKNIFIFMKKNLE